MGKNLILCKNAKHEEIKAYKVLRDIFFKDKVTVIGDDIAHGLPDIYTHDHSIGVEVTSVEHLSQFLLESKQNASKNNAKYLNDAKYILDFYNGMSLRQKNIYFNEEFEKVLEKKIKKISNYKSCGSVNLIIMSDNELKPYVRRESLAKIYRDLTIKHNVKYDNLFLYYNNCLYVEINSKFLKIKKIKVDTLEK